MRDNKLLTLHHELLYPGFLGAVLFEFARKVYPEKLPHVDFDWAVWLLTALFFVAYFSAAFLALSEAEKDQAKAEARRERTIADAERSILNANAAMAAAITDDARAAAQTALDRAQATQTNARNEKNDFGWVAFVANLGEIALILWIAIVIGVVDPAAAHGVDCAKTPADPVCTKNPYEFNYALVCLSWILIPILAWISNGFSRRPVRVILSVPAMAVGAVGLLLNYHGALSGELYLAGLALMYGLLAVYYVVVFSGGRLPFDHQHT